MNDLDHLSHRFHLADLERQVARARQSPPVAGGAITRAGLGVAVLVVCVALAVMAGGWIAPPAVMG